MAKRLPYVRRPDASDPFVSHTFRCTDAQLKKFNTKGGGAWLRDKLDKTRKPAKAITYHVPRGMYACVVDPMKQHTFRCTEKQWEKFCLLGGAAWLREQLEA